jgi:hypothetical protein
MELGKIKARIREKGCNPSIPLVVPGSNQILWVTVQKSSLMTELDKLFPTKVSETGLMFDDEDRLTPVKGQKAVPIARPQAPEPGPEIGDADLLADDEDLLGEDLLDDDDDLLA